MVSRADRYTTRAASQIFYSDFNNSFGKNTSSGSLNRITNEDSVKQSLKNIILTNYGERLYQSTIGGNINLFLFQNIDNFTAGDMEQEITLTIRNHEPRVGDLAVNVIPYPERNEYKIIIEFVVINSKTTSSLDLTLKKVR